jgi:hypothetical protein
MKRKFHVRFCNGGGAGDRSTDRNEPTRYARPHECHLACLSFWLTQRHRPGPRAAQP